MKKILLFMVVMAVVAGCGKDSDGITLTPTNRTMHYGDEFQIQASSNNPVTYTSENEYHAKVSSDGLITARHIGETNIVVDNGSRQVKFKTTVIPQSNLYPEADLTFGMTRSAVKAKYGTPDAETDTVVGYENYSTNAPIFMCLFDANDKLSSFLYMVKTAYSSALGAFLAERYELVTVDEENYAFLFANALTPNATTMVVGVDVYNAQYWQVLHLKYTHSETRALSQRREITAAINELMAKID